MPPFYAYSGQRGLERAQIDLKAPAGRDGVPPARRRRRRGDRELPARASSTGSASATTPCAPRNPGIVYCSTSGYGQDGPCARAGRPRPQLPGRGRLPRTCPSARDEGRPPLPGATVADIAAGGMHAAAAILAALVGAGDDGRGRLPRRVGGRRRAVDAVALHRRVPGHRRGARARPLHPHRPLRLLRRLPDRATAGGWPSGPSSREFWANLCRLLGLRPVDRAPDRRRACRTRSGPTCGLRSPPATRDEWVDAAGRRRHLRRPGARHRRGGRRPAGRGPGCRRRGPHPAAPAVPPARPAAGRRAAARTATSCPTPP